MRSQGVKKPHKEPDKEKRAKHPSAGTRHIYGEDKVKMMSGRDVYQKKRISLMRYCQLWLTCVFFLKFVE